MAKAKTDAQSGCNGRARAQHPDRSQFNSDLDSVDLKRATNRPNLVAFRLIERSSHDR
jgi:hypothetical protein